MFSYSGLISFAALCSLAYGLGNIDADGLLLQAVNRGDTDAIDTITNGIVERMNAPSNYAARDSALGQFREIAMKEYTSVTNLIRYLKSLKNGIENNHDHEFAQYVTILNNMTTWALANELGMVDNKEVIIIEKGLPDVDDVVETFDIAYTDAMSRYAESTSSKMTPVIDYLEYLFLRMCPIWTKLYSLKNMPLAKQVEEVAAYVKRSITGPAEISAVYTILRYIEYAENILDDLLENNLKDGAGLFALRHKSATVDAVYFLSQARFYVEHIQIAAGSRCVLPFSKEDTPERRRYY